mgnify:CR=1 FL=1
MYALGFLLVANPGGISPDRELVREAFISTRVLACGIRDFVLSRASIWQDKSEQESYHCVSEIAYLDDVLIHSPSGDILEKSSAAEHWVWIVKSSEKKPNQSGLEGTLFLGAR